MKLKEITYAHCEGIFSSEFKHGPLRPAAVHDSYPVIIITAPGDEAMMINHVNEGVTTRGGPVAATASPSRRKTRPSVPTSTTISSFPRRIASCRPSC